MIEFSTLDALGFRLRLYGRNSPNLGFLMYQGQHVGEYDGNEGRVTMLEHLPTNITLGSISSVELYVTALEVLTKEGIPFTGPKLEDIISKLHKMRAAINGFEERIQNLKHNEESI